VKRVSAYEAEGISMLVVDYVEEVDGDAELYFKADGIEDSPPPSDEVRMVSDRPELRKSRFWRMPGGLDESVRRELQSKIESQYLNKTIQVPSGQLWQFFQVTLPDGSIAHVIIGARDGKR
jgi:hypothetical protein